MDTAVFDAMAHAVLRDASEAPFPRHPLMSPKVQTWVSSKIEAHSRDIVGLGLAAAIFGAWLATLPLMFAQPSTLVPSVLGSGGGNLVASAAAIFAFRTWITTGLFVTVHDAIHGQVCPSFRKLNHVLGAICAFCYASFSYKLLYREHWR